MTAPVLLVATATLSPGAARMPRELARAGFEVSLLAPQGSLAEKSRHLAQIGHVPDDAGAAQWVQAFAAMVDAARPRIVLPTDDMAFRLLQMLATEAPPGMSPARHLLLAALVRESLGEPASYLTSVDGTLLPAAAAALGVRVAPYPLPTDGGQRRIHYAAAAWRGTLLAGWGMERIGANPDYDGPWSVARHFHDAQARAMTARLVEGFGMAGLLSAEIVLDERTDQRALVAISRRPPPGMHGGSRVGVDLCAALLAAVEGRPGPTGIDPDANASGVSVQFPDELLRDPASAWLRNHPVDVPWDEPELFEALLTLRRGP